jgi:hypothetical protein
MLRYLKRAMRERLLREPPAILAVLPVALLLISGPASAVLGEDSASRLPDQSDEINEGEQNNNPSFRVEGRPEIQFNVTRADGARPIEQVIVRGQRPLSAYRRRVELEVEETWEAFNEANSDDAFDVHCHYEAPTGTRILQQVCRPQFLDDAMSRAARAFRLLDGTISFGQQYEAMMEVYYRDEQLRSEMRNLAASEPALREQLAILDEQLERYEEARRNQD